MVTGTTIGQPDGVVLGENLSTVKGVYVIPIRVDAPRGGFLDAQDPEINRKVAAWFAVHKKVRARDVYFVKAGGMFLQTKSKAKPDLVWVGANHKQPLIYEVRRATFFGQKPRVWVSGEVQAGFSRMEIYLTTACNQDDINKTVQYDKVRDDFHRIFMSVLTGEMYEVDRPSLLTPAERQCVWNQIDIAAYNAAVMELAKLMA